VTAPQRGTLRHLLIGDFSAERAVVLTPIEAMFRQFTTHGWAPARTSGWWPRLERDGVHIVLVPQGTALLDLCPALQGTPQVHFLGYAGALSPTIEVGTIAEPGAAILLGDERCWHLRGDPHQVIVTVPNLMAGYERAATLAEQACLTDMESAHLASGLTQHGGPTLTVRVLVTDRWPDAPFYAADTTRAALLRERRTNLVDDCAQELR